MRNPVQPIAAWSALALFLAACSRAQEPKHEEALEKDLPARWHRDFGPARDEARAAKKPLLVVFRCVP